MNEQIPQTTAAECKDLKEQLDTAIAKNTGSLTPANISAANEKVPYKKQDVFGKEPIKLEDLRDPSVTLRISRSGAFNTKVLDANGNNIRLIQSASLEFTPDDLGLPLLKLAIINPKIELVD